MSLATTRKSLRKKIPQISAARRAQLLRAMPSRIQKLKELNLVRIVSTPPPSIPTTPEDTEQANQLAILEKEKEEKMLKSLEEKLESLNSEKHALFLSLKEILHDEELASAQAQKELKQSQSNAPKATPSTYMQQPHQTFVPNFHYNEPGLNPVSSPNINKHLPLLNRGPRPYGNGRMDPIPDSNYYKESDAGYSDARNHMANFQNMHLYNQHAMGHPPPPPHDHQQAPLNFDEIKKFQLAALIQSQQQHHHHQQHHQQQQQFQQQYQQGRTPSPTYYNGFQGGGANNYSPAKQSNNSRFYSPSSSHTHHLDFHHQRMMPHHYNSNGNGHHHQQHAKHHQIFSHQRKEVSGYW